MPDEDQQPLTLKTLILWGSIFVSIMGGIGTAVGYYLSLRMDVTIAQHDIEINRASIARVDTEQKVTAAKFTDMDKKLTEVVTILRRLDAASLPSGKVYRNDDQ